MNIDNEAAVTVLVTDGENRSSLAVTRSLGRYGCRVVVLGRSLENLASSSRYCSASYSVSDPITNGVSFFIDVVSVVGRENIDFIFPMTEPAVLVLAEHRAELPKKVQLATSQIEQIETVFDKFAVFQLAKKMGVAIPETIFIQNREDFFDKMPDICNFPVVVKPSMSRILVNGNFIQTKIVYAKDYDDLVQHYKTEEALSYPSMIQEKIVGPGTGLFTLFDGDRHLALFAHKRLREKPPSGGVSVVSESVALDGEMVVAAEKLLSEAKWNGVAMVEFKRDDRDGRAKLMEINGRFWGSLQLAISAGVDFPVLLLRNLQGNLVEPQKLGYRQGLKMKWLLGTLDHIIIRLKNKDELNLPPNFSSKWQAVVDFFRIKETQMVFDVFQRDDINPFWFEVKKYVQDLLFKKKL